MNNRIKIVNDYTPTATQAIAHRAYQRYKLFGGAMGGGKSRWLCEEVKNLSLKYPGNRGIMCRYHLSDFKNSTLKTLIECLPEDLIKNHNLQDHTTGHRNRQTAARSNQQFSYRRQGLTGMASPDR